MTTYRITEHIPIEYASKEIQYGTDDPYDPDDPQQVSEWAMAITLSSFPVGNLVTDIEFNEQLKKAKLQQDLDRLVENGLIEASWDEKQGAIAYKITEAGVARVEKKS